MNTTQHLRGTRLRVLAVVSDASSSGDRDRPYRDRPDRGRVKIIRAADAFDRRDHEISVVAYELHVRATLDSAALDHPGLVPDEYLASLTSEDVHSPGAILAGELCTAGVWRCTDGGYRVLDWPAVQAAIEHVRELRAVDKPARNRRERP